MRKGILFTTFVIITQIVAAQQSAIDYNNRIITHQDKISEALTAFTHAFSDTTLTKGGAQAYLLIVSNITEAAIKDVQTMGDYQGDTTFKNAAIDLFSFYFNTVQLEYAAIVDIMFLENISLDDYNKINTIIANIVEAESAYDAAFTGAQQAFANRFGFTLIND